MIEGLKRSNGLKRQGLRNCPGSLCRCQRILLLRVHFLFLLSVNHFSQCYRNENNFQKQDFLRLNLQMLLGLGSSKMKLEEEKRLLGRGGLLCRSCLLGGIGEGFFVGLSCYLSGFGLNFPILSLLKNVVREVLLLYLLVLPGSILKEHLYRHREIQIHWLLRRCF